MSQISFCVIFLFFFVGSQLVEAQSNVTLSQLLENDMAAVRYAFAFEKASIAFYDFGLQNYPESYFRTANVSYSLFEVMSNQTKAHALLLQNYYQQTFGALLTENCSASYTAASFPDYLSQAVTQEYRAVGVYNYLITTAYTRSLLTTFATIGEVKSKHSFYLNKALLQTSVFSAFDNILTQLSPITSASCPTVLPPVVLTPLPPVSAQEGPSRTPILSKRALSDSTVDGVNPSLAALTDNDLKALNLVLALNELQVALLNYAVTAFPSPDLATKDHLLKQNMAIRDLLNMSRAVAYSPCLYSFPQVTSRANYISTAVSIFDQSTAVLNGILLRIYNKQLLLFVASLAGTNSRFAAMYSTMAGLSPFPSDLTTSLPPSAAQTLIDQYATTCVNPLPTPLLFVVIPADFTPTPTVPQSTPGTCLVSDFRFDAASWSTNPSMNLTVQNASLTVSSGSGSPRFYFVAPSRYRGNLSSFFAGGNGTVSVVYGSSLTGDGTSGLVIRGGNGNELVYPFTTTSSLFIASFGSGLWLVRAQGSNASATPATPADIAGVLTYVQCFLVEGSSSLKGFNLCDGTPAEGSDCPNRCSGHGVCTPNFPFGATCSCNYGYTGTDCSTRVRSQTGRFRLPAKVVSWNYGL